MFISHPEHERLIASQKLDSLRDSASRHRLSRSASPRIPVSGAWTLGVLGLVAATAFSAVAALTVTL